MVADVVKTTHDSVSFSCNSYRFKNRKPENISANSSTDSHSVRNQKKPVCRKLQEPSQLMTQLVL